MSPDRSACFFSSRRRTAAEAQKVMHEANHRALCFATTIRFFECGLPVNSRRFLERRATLPVDLPEPSFKNARANPGRHTSCVSARMESAVGL